MESLWKRLSGMDAARAAMGHGWPFAAGLWNGDGVSEPRRSRGRMIGRRVLVTFALKSDSPDRAKREMSANRRKQLERRKHPRTHTNLPVRRQD